MKNIREQIDATSESLLSVLTDLQERLITAGFDEELIEEGIFHVSDILRHMRNLELRLIDICEMNEIQKVPQKLNQFANHILIGTHEHDEYHMGHLKQLLSSIVPDEDTDPEETDSDEELNE